MSRGRIREQGTHEELLRLGGRYFRLHQAQSQQSGASEHMREQARNASA
jgi:hypothetical protein